MLISSALSQKNPIFDFYVSFRLSRCMSPSVAECQCECNAASRRAAPRRVALLCEWTFTRVSQEWQKIKNEK